MMRKQSIVKLRAVFPAQRFSTSPEDLVACSYDASRQEFAAEAMAWPKTAREVSDVMRLASADGFPVYLRGAGSGMSGGALPVRGGVVLDFSKMNRLTESRPQDRLAICEPGMTLGALQERLKPDGLFFPPDPASHDFATLGGAVAECAGGLRAVKYGVTRDYVVGLEVVLPSGEIIDTGRAVLKSVAGYDITRLLVGSEGTLAVFTKIIVRVLPIPEKVIALLAYFDGADGAVHCARSILASLILPRAMEFMDRGALACVSRYRDFGIPAEAGSALLVEFDGAASAARAEAQRCEGIFNHHEPLAVRQAESEEEREELWTVRRSISPALFRHAPVKLNEDVCVPISRLADALAEFQAIGERFSVDVINFGHAGDGNIHVNVMVDDRNQDEMRRGRQAVGEIFEAAVRMGGSISGEHGIGNVKAAFLPLELSRAEMQLMRSLKKLFDPKGILNPGKIFAEDPG